MRELLTNLEFWRIVAGLAWPAVFLVAFFALRRQVAKIFDRDEMEIEVAGLRVRVSDATKQIGKQSAELVDRVAALESALPARDRHTDAATSSTNFSILWVDDYPSNNAFLIDKFRTDGVEVDLSMTTADALRKLKQRPFNVLISDLGRKEEGADNPFAGLDLLNGLTALGTRLPSVIYAGKRGLAHERQLKQAGAELVTASPVEVMAFVDHYRNKLASKSAGI